MDIGAADIRRWHRAKGWLDIGYHFVIRRDGTVETGRNIATPGAHVAGFNSCSIGICMVGGQGERGNPENNFTEAQFRALYHQLQLLQAKFPNAAVQGHRDFPKVAKDCPSFDVREWLASHD